MALSCNWYKCSTGWQTNIGKSRHLYYDCFRILWSSRLTGSQMTFCIKIEAIVKVISIMRSWTEKWFFADVGEARWDRFVYIWRAAVIPVEPVNSSDLKSCRRGADLLVDFEKVIFCPSSYHFSLSSHFHWDIQITENSIWYKNKFHNNCHFESND